MVSSTQWVSIGLRNSALVIVLLLSVSIILTCALRISAVLYSGSRGFCVSIFAHFADNSLTLRNCCLNDAREIRVLDKFADVT